MPFIGQQPVTGAYHKLDAITASATATYNLLLNGGAYSPASANHLLVSLNGVMQAPQDSFTVSGSTITFASALTSSDNIDFIMALGDVLNIGTPTDGSVTSAKLDVNAITPITRDTSNNRIGIGNTSPDRTVSIKHASQAEIGFKTGSVSNGALIYYNDSENKLLLRANESGERIEFQTGGTSVRASITDDGICFGTDTAAANALDDYETGTWTPSTNIGFNSITDASYVKVGKLVFVNLSAQTNTGPNDVSQATSVSGLPFACRTGNAVSNSVIIEGLNQDVYAEIAGNSYSQIDKDNGTPITRGEFGNQRNCRVTLVYSIA